MEKKILVMQLSNLKLDDSTTSLKKSHFFQDSFI